MQLSVNLPPCSILINVTFGYRSSDGFLEEKGRGAFLVIELNILIKELLSLPEKRDMKGKNTVPSARRLISQSN